MIKTIFNNKITYIILIIYTTLLLWWLILLIKGSTKGINNDLFGFVYSFIALIGGTYGLCIANYWGGIKSLVGRGIIFFSLGLLGQFFGQFVWSYYNIVANIEIPYPSLADIGYFSIIPLFILGMLSFAKATRVKITLKKIHGKALVICIPTAMLTLAYILFLKDLKIEPEQPIKTFLNFGYPIGEALAISVTLITLGLSHKILGGKMRNRILLLMGAQIAQYLTDTTFLYKVAHGTYYNASIVDLMYATTFVLTSLGLISLRTLEENG